MTLTQARVRARLNSASGSSSSDGGPPAAATVPVEDFKSWKEKASGGTRAHRHMPLFICFCYLCDCSRSQLILLLPTGMTFNPRRLIVLLPIGVTSYTRGG